MLSPHQLRLLTSFKASLSSVIAIGLAMAWNWEHPYWAGISTLVVTLPYMGAALEKAMMRVVGTVFAGVVLYLISGLFPQFQAGYVALMALFLILSGYFGSGTWYPYTFILFGLTLNILVTNTFQNPGDLFPFVYFRISEICLGVVVALAVNAIFWPQNAGRAFLRQTAEELEQCRALFQGCTGLFFHDRKAQEDFAGVEKAITGQLSKLHPLLLQAQRDSSQVHKYRQGFDDFLRVVEELFITLSMLRRASEARYPKGYKDELMPELDAFLAALERQFDDVIESLKSGDLPKMANSENEGQAVDAKVNELRLQDVNLKYPIEDTTHLYAILASLFDVKKSLQSLQAIVTEINGGAARPHQDKSRVPRKKHFDRRRLQHGIKVAIACVGAIYAWQWFKWPGGAQAAITAGIVMQLSMVASNHKGLMRLGGCLLGGALGAFSLVFLEPYISSYVFFWIPLFAIFMVFSWLHFGSGPYAYAGFQAYLAFLLMTAVTNTQNISLKPGLDRFMGILLGLAICLVVLRLFWPIIPERELRRDLGQFFRRACDFLRAYTPERLTGRSAHQALALLSDRVTPLAASSEVWLSQIAMPNEAETKTRIRQFMLTAQTLCYRIRALEQTYEREIPEALRDILAPQILSINAAVTQALDALADSFAKCQAPEKAVDFDKPLRELTQATYKLFREDKVGRPYLGHQVAGLLGLLRRYRALANEAKQCLELAHELDYRALQRAPFF